MGKKQAARRAAARKARSKDGSKTEVRKVPLRPPEISQGLDRFLAAQEDYFHLTDACEALGERADREDVAAALSARHDVLFAPGKDEMAYACRAVFFEGLRFRVKLTTEERRAQVLIPGHRYLPYVADSVHPANVVILDPDEEVVPKRPFGASVDSLRIYLSMFSEMGVIAYLLCDGIDVEDPDFHAESPIEITALDLSNLPANSVSANGTMLLEVLDWERGVLQIVREQVEPDAPLDFAATASWVKSMSKGLEAAFEVLGARTTVADQLAHGILFSGMDLDKAPPLHLGGYLQAQDKIRLVSPTPELTILWHEPLASMEEVNEHPGQVETGTALETDALSRALSQRGYLLSSVEMEAIMRNTVIAGQRFNDAVTLGIDDVRIVRRDKALMEPLEDLWQYVKDTPEITNDANRRALRDAAVALLLRRINCVRSLDVLGVDPNSADPEKLEAFSRLGRMIHEMLLVAERAESLDQALADRLVDAMMESESAIEEVISGLEALLDKAVNPTTNCYQLRISLRGSDPEIWRQIVVPASISLDRLHVVIQRAMGWKNAHMHLFTIKKRRYEDHQELGDFAFADVGSISEVGVRLDTLVSRARTKFTYLYDFGDSWEHDLVLEKVHRDVEDGTIRCLAGENACPPEDIGGVWGYQRCLTAICDEEHPLHDDYVHRVGAGFDPTAFDLNAVNKILAKVRV